MSNVLHFNESLILKIDGQPEQNELLSILANQLYEQGYVKNTYKDAILERKLQHQPDFIRKISMLPFPIQIQNM